MTYSRPGIRRTASANSAAPTRKGGVRGTSVQTGSNSRFQSFGSADQAGKNARQGYDDIKNFLTEIAEPVTEYLKQEDIADANRQVGELIQSTPNLGQLYADAPDEAKAKMRSKDRGTDGVDRRVTTPSTKPRPTPKISAAYARPSGTRARPEFATYVKRTRSCKKSDDARSCKK